jgi:hypothetical protein
LRSCALRPLHSLTVAAPLKVDRRLMSSQKRNEPIKNGVGGRMIHVDTKDRCGSGQGNSARDVLRRSAPHPRPLRARTGEMWCAVPKNSVDYVWFSVVCVWMRVPAGSACSDGGLAMIQNDTSGNAGGIVGMWEEAGGDAGGPGVHLAHPAPPLPFRRSPGQHSCGSLWLG